MDDRVKKFMKASHNETESKTPKNVPEIINKLKETKIKSDKKPLNNEINYETKKINLVKNPTNNVTKDCDTFKNPKNLFNSTKFDSHTEEKNKFMKTNSNSSKMKEYSKIETGGNEIERIKNNNENKIISKFSKINDMNESSVSQTSNESYDKNEDSFFQNMIDIKDLNEVFDSNDKGNLSSHQDAKKESTKDQHTKLNSQNNLKNSYENDFVEVDEKSNLSELEKDNRLSDSLITKDNKQLSSLDGEKNILSGSGDNAVHFSLKDKKNEKKLASKQDSKRVSKKDISQTIQYEKNLYSSTNQSSEKIKSFTISDINLLANLISENIKSILSTIATPNTKDEILNGTLNFSKQNGNNHTLKKNSYAQTDPISNLNIEKHWILKDDNDFSKQYKPQNGYSFTKSQNYSSSLPNQPSLNDDYKFFSHNLYHQFKLPDFPTFIEPELLGKLLSFFQNNNIFYFNASFTTTEISLKYIMLVAKQ